MNGPRPPANSASGSAPAPNAKLSDLFGTSALRQHLASMAQDQSLTFTDRSLTYLALAAEHRLRSLLSSTISAQIHRTSSTHLRQPPLAAAPSSAAKEKDKGKEKEKALWSHRVTSDPTAILEELARRNKEAEQAFRAERMDRLARETEVARRTAAAAVGIPTAMAAASTSPPPSADQQQPSSTGDADASSSTPPPDAAPSTPAKDPNAAPVFGAVTEKRSGSSTKKSGKKAGGSSRDVSAEVQLKMSNATAMQSVGMFNKKQYSWLNSVPSVSSPLAGRKRKGGAAAGEDAGGGGEGAATGEIGKKKKAKSKAKAEDGDAASDPATGGEEGALKGGLANGEGAAGEEEGRRPKKKARAGLGSGGGGGRGRGVALSKPARRLVVVGKDDKGEARKVEDDRAVTVRDLMFALDREGAGRGRGMGTGDEVLWRVGLLGGLKPREEDGPKRESRL